METALHRLKQFIDYKKLSVSQFEKNTGFSNGAFSSQLKNNKTIGVDKLENILKVYPEISAQWLLTGKGNMLLNTDKESIKHLGAQTEVKTNPDHQFDDFKKVLESVFKNNNESFEINYNEIVPVGYYVRLYSKLKKQYPDLFRLKTDIDILISFKDAINDLTIKQLNELQAKLWYHKGKFNQTSYENQVIEAINRLKEFEHPLSSISKSIVTFYHEMKNTGSCNVDFDNYLTDDQ